jgi:hypothetical protein
VLGLKNKISQPWLELSTSRAITIGEQLSLTIPRNDVSNSSSNVLHITNSPGNQVNVAMLYRLASSFAIVHADIESSDLGIGLLDFLFHPFQ